jgi:adenylate cyclase
VSLSLLLGGLLAASLLAAGVLALSLISLKNKNALLGLRVERNAMELERLQRSFARFAPAALVERIASDGRLSGAERREVTVMFADIRGFTRLSENLDPAVVVEMLNGYFREMSLVIQAHHGHITRLMGDGIMSVFGALEPNSWHVQDAVEAAIGMRQALARYNESLRARGLPELGFGVGLNCGQAVAGLVGSDELLEFTVMGDVVNVALPGRGLDPPPGHRPPGHGGGPRPAPIRRAAPRPGDVFLRSCVFFRMTFSNTPLVMMRPYWPRMVVGRACSGLVAPASSRILLIVSSP